MLVELDADKEAKTANGWTPLHYAAVSGHVDAVTVLVQMGVDKEAKGSRDWVRDSQRKILSLSPGKGLHHQRSSSLQVCDPVFNQVPKPKPHPLTSGMGCYLRPKQPGAPHTSFGTYLETKCPASSMWSMRATQYACLGL